MKDSIFISYRIADTGDVTGRIYDYLVQHFGKERVFKDVQGIGLGLDFRKEIEKALNNCGVMLAVIGPTWLTVTDKEGNRRLDNPGDWVRFEIETALSKEIPLIPLRVKGATLPMESELPNSIKDLAYRNATEIKLNDPEFGKDMGWLVEKMKDIGLFEKPTVVNQSNQQNVLLDNLTPEQRKELRAALESAFPEPQNLELMIYDEFEISFNSITQGQANYQIGLRKLVEWGESQGKLEHLLKGAVTANPGNPKLKKLVSLWLNI